MIQAKDLKNFLKDIPDNAEVMFNKGSIVFLFDGNTKALNKWGAEWDNGVGYINGECCGECSHFDCSKCREEIN